MKRLARIFTAGWVVLVVFLLGVGVLHVSGQGTAFWPYSVAPTMDAAYDIGMATNRIRSLYLLGYAPTLSPVLIPIPTPNGTGGLQEQSFTVTGLATTDMVFINGPAQTAFCPALTARVSVANTLVIGFFQNTTAACQPASGVYNIRALK